MVMMQFLTFRLRTRLPLTAWAMLLFLFAGHAAAGIQASLDRNPVALGESFTLTFELNGDSDGDPDFKPLETDFDIIDQSQSNQFSLSNGQASSSINWTLQLIPKRAGALTIPPIRFGSEQSNALPLTVKGAAAGTTGNASPDNGITIEVTAEPKQPYVQAQILYTVKVLHRVQLGGNLSEPEVADALVEKLGDDRRYTVNRDSVIYTVTERRYAIFPQKSGPLRIAPLHLEAQIAGGSRSPFDRFLYRGTRSVRLDSNAVELDVKPIPPEFTGKAWLPAEALDLDDSWAQNTPQIATGEPVTRTLTLKAKGATVGLLPELGREPAHGGAGDIKQYPDQPVLNEEKQLEGVSSSRQEKTAFIIGQPGTYRMPAIEIPWWNTQTNRAEVARVPERIVTVLPSAQYRPTEPTTITPPPEAGNKAAEPPPATSSVAPASAATGDLWFWLSLVSSLGWVATGMAWWWTRRNRPARATSSGAAETPAKLSARSAAADLEKACRGNNPTAARQALTAWSEARWPGTGMGIAELQRRVDGRDGSFAGEIKRLNQVLYGRGVTEAWSGDRLWAAFNDFNAAGSDKAQPAAAQLEPLHRLVT